MGLDTVELLMEVEKTFGINIADKEAEQIRTVGDFYEVVWRHIGAKQSDQCKSQYLFYKLRKTLHNSFAIPLHQIKPAAVPETFFPKEHRRRIYKDFSADTGYELPPLILTTPWLQILNGFGWLSIAGSLTAAIFLYYFKDWSGWIFLSPAVGIFLTIQLDKLLEPQKTVVAQTSLRDFINEMLVLNFAKLNADAGANRKEMEAVMNKIIVDFSGVDVSEVHAGASITDDLGMD